MPLFALICRDAPGMLETRLAVRPQHLDWLGQRAGLQFAGPFIENGQPCGSLVVVEGESLDEVRAWAARDPYAEAGVFDSAEVREWRKVIG
ncbi:MAG: YciI family protein [Paracoccus sp. (in: a-proteobacteria)]|uniref:YciI family protein n=1 Tax=Paracoccus sp. TaxID=267 RepID=UPI0039E5BC67